MIEMAKNYLALARTASISRNYEEACGYYNKVLEVDPTNAIAWFGKGEAVGWLSTVQALRLEESLVCFQNSIRFAQDDIAIEKKCAVKINEIATACYGICREHALKFIALENIWGSYIVQSSQIIGAYEFANSLDPENKDILRNVIAICEENIKGVSYTDEFDNKTNKAVFLSAEYEKNIRDILSLFGGKLKELEPSYQPSNPVAAKPESACFIVAATIGSESGFIIEDLRLFRDRWISNFEIGRGFIKWYYRNGPIAADAISDSRVLRVISFVFIVLPCWVMSRFIMRLIKK
ncbi:TPA: tetratricopeptide repeat protein [Klebsiella pneumoniae]